MFFIAIFNSSLAVAYFVVFFLGFCLIGRFTCGFVLFVELLPEKYKAISGSAILIGYSISLLEVTAYYAFISQNSITTIWLGFILSTITFFANFIIPESPQWLVSQGQYDKARASLMRVAKWNGVKVEKFDAFVDELKAGAQGANEDENLLNPSRKSEVAEAEDTASKELML